MTFYDTMCFQTIGVSFGKGFENEGSYIRKTNYRICCFDFIFSLKKILYG